MIIFLGGWKLETLEKNSCTFLGMKDQIAASPGINHMADWNAAGILHRQ